MKLFIWNWIRLMSMQLTGQPLYSMLYILSIESLFSIFLVHTLYQRASEKSSAVTSSIITIGVMVMKLNSVTKRLFTMKTQNCFRCTKGVQFQCIKASVCVWARAVAPYFCAFVIFFSCFHWKWKFQCYRGNAFHWVFAFNAL